MTSIVVYKDELNTVPLRNFNSKEMDLFFGICSKLRNKGSSTVTFSFGELRELSDYKFSAYNRFINDIEGVYDKLLKLDIRLGKDNEFTKFVLFTQYAVSLKNESVQIKINEEFKYILNNIIRGFTKFELEEFTRLNSSYSKTAYRLLKQFRATGYYIVKIKEFRRLFDVPESYKMTNIDQRILQPIKRELPKHFRDLKITKIRGKGKRSRFIEYIEFKFQAETDIKNGNKTFRDEQTGEYYDKDIMQFDSEEVKKVFPDVSPASDLIELKKQMGLSKENYSSKQIDKILNVAMKKIKDSNLEVDVYEYIKNCNNYVLSKKKIRDKYNYLLATITDDYDNKLEQASLFE